MLGGGRGVRVYYKPNLEPTLPSNPGGNFDFDCDSDRDWDSEFCNSGLDVLPLD